MVEALGWSEVTFTDPFTGRAISDATFYARAEAYQVQREVLADQFDYTVLRLENAISRRSANYWTRESERAWRELATFDAGLEDMERQAEFAPLAVQEEEEEEEEEPEYAEESEDFGELEPYMDLNAEELWLEETAEEWEFGFDYEEKPA